MNKLNIIQCYIRKEFDNQLLIENFVKNNKNTFWYFVSPQSQDSVDDFNKTIKIILFLQKIQQRLSLIEKTEYLSFNKDKKHSITKYASSLIVKMAHDKDMRAKLEGYITKSKKVEIEKETKYETAQ